MGVATTASCRLRRWLAGYPDQDDEHGRGKAGGTRRIERRKVRLELGSREAGSERRRCRSDLMRRKDPAEHDASFFPAECGGRELAVRFLWCDK